MKTTIALMLLAAGSAFAGASYEPAPIGYESATWRWFAGGTIGYMNESDTPLYTIHVGAETPWRTGQLTTSVYLEAGWANPDESDSVGRVEADVVPLTLNLKFDHAFSERFHGYFGGGIGAAFVNIESDGPFSGLDDEDTVFVGQLFAGLGYDFSPTSEIFGGLRWISFDDANFGLGNAELGDEFVYEAGLRFRF